MKRRSYGGLTVIFIVCLLAYSLGAISGMYHLGEDYSNQIMPTSLRTSEDVISVIDEKDFEAENITVKLYIPKPAVKYTVKNNTNDTNSTNSTNTTDTSVNTTNNNYTNHT